MALPRVMPISGPNMSAFKVRLRLFGCSILVSSCSVACSVSPDVAVAVAVDSARQTSRRNRLAASRRLAISFLFMMMMMVVVVV